MVCLCFCDDDGQNVTDSTSWPELQFSSNKSTLEFLRTLYSYIMVIEVIWYSPCTVT